MAREKENYRLELEQLVNYFGDKRVLTISDVAEYTGRGRRWVKKAYNIDPVKGITIVALARELS